MKPHKHAKLIKAWADEAEIQFVRWLWAYRDCGVWKQFDRYFSEAEAHQWFGKNWECEYKKLEWSREEFDE